MDSQERKANEVFHVPVRPYTPIDAINRRAAALGSPAYAHGAAYALYNGHTVTVHWNEYRGYYIAEYWWAGRVVLQRGTFQQCLDAALDEYRRGALGAAVTVVLKLDDQEALDICKNCLGLLPGAEPPAPWMTWRHTAAARSVRDYAHPYALVMRFDWELMQAAETEEAYEEALRQKYGTVWY